MLFKHIERTIWQEIGYSESGSTDRSRNDKIHFNNYNNVGSERFVSKLIAPIISVYGLMPI